MGYERIHNVIVNKTSGTAFLVVFLFVCFYLPTFILKDNTTFQVKVSENKDDNYVLIRAHRVSK